MAASQAMPSASAAPHQAAPLPQVAALPTSHAPTPLERQALRDRQRPAAQTPGAQNFSVEIHSLPTLRVVTRKSLQVKLMLSGGLVVERDEEKQPEPVCPMPTPSAVVVDEGSAPAPKKRGRPKKTETAD